ncbi:MAG TPA: sigma-70 family RNA polymerase sigma factor [Candidatus Methylomirabilis sp.]|nr:sigma-70 family RNA polymerase sigma factor [Candidatus Methylomirabilis sp.]
MASASVVFDSYSFANIQRPQPFAVGKRNALAAARSGNAEAFAEMVMPYAPGLYRRALRMTGSPADAEDVRQDALLKAFSRLNQFAGQQSEQKDDLHAWVSRITTNASIDLIRQRRDGKYISLEEPGISPEETFGSRLAARTDNPEERYSRREMRKLIAGVIACLPADLRQICLLRDVLQYSTHEVAARLRISSVAVRLRLFRAHRRLREDLRERLRRKQLRQPAQIATPRAINPAFAGRKEEFLPLAARAEFACGD